MRHRVTSSLVAAILALLVGGPVGVGARQATPDATPAAEAEVLAAYTLADIPLAELQNEALPDSPIADDRGLLLGGIGSDLWRGPDDPADEFWMVTDRGPNGQTEVDGENRRTFPVPDFTPLILHVRLAGEAVEILEAIPIVGETGAPVTGLSNIADVDELPYDYAAEEELSFDPSGLDTEGLVRTSAGDFWLTDEYSPSLVHVDAAGQVVARYVPEGLDVAGADYPVSAVLPAIFGECKGNRGFEGLALSADETTLYLTLQSPLANPDGETGEASRNGRILAFDLAGERPSAEYVYRFEVGTEFDPDPEATQDDMKLSGAVALDETTLLILERTDNLACLYTVDLAGATDILGREWDDAATEPTLEALNDPADEGIEALPKTLAVDLAPLAEVPGKIEGVAVVDATTVAIANDNDFDVNEFDAEGRHISTGATSQVLLVRTAPLPGVE